VTHMGSELEMGGAMVSRGESLHIPHINHFVEPPWVLGLSRP